MRRRDKVATKGHERVVAGWEGSGENEESATNLRVRGPILLAVMVFSGSAETYFDYQAFVVGGCGDGVADGV